MNDAEIKLYASFKRHHKYADNDDPLSITVDVGRITLSFGRQRDPESISLTDSEWEQAVALVNEMRGRRDTAMRALDAEEATG